MVLPIILYGNSILKTKARDIPIEYPNLQELIVNMWDTMNFAKGVGLAAPQIGLPIRLFVVDSIPYYEKKSIHKGIRKVFINATILEETGPEWPFEEGCLSIPKINAEVERTTHVKIQYLDEQFKKHIEVYDEMNARIIQHEYDHIEGILFIDKIKPVRRQILQKKLDKIRKGIVDAAYPVKL
ncbi:MAG: peptide deformylase [Saprospiraceae bacterium]|nr:peptide deformylase [Saprospiraceae bacterium]MBK8483390.1 peptide deformylase [Saprospiraceae bacterium]MBK9722254.1 peptide deformylase [Saprospiraceae bacterium]MBK9729275.1 peptide deformylase [Saprospiraceae bacterium]